MADQKIVKEKRSRNGETLERVAAADVNGDEIRIDMKILAKEMREEDPLPGAYCQDYEQFNPTDRWDKGYQKDMGAFLILFTLTDMANEFPTLEQRDYQLELLGQAIQNNLRMGDFLMLESSSACPVLQSCCPTRRRRMWRSLPGVSARRFTRRIRWRMN